MDDIDLHKRRFKIFVIVDIVMVLLVAAGVYAVMIQGYDQARPLWIGALLVGFAAQIWFIMGFARSLPKKGG